ncbi:site-specific integrase [Rheinheimera sp. UJ51]|uniref:tyrosine-type recombinase/integrase n=1 Tax=Rheinheimera sp. UJ51 TaxID=2892446 RepID=UPI001E2F9FC7|nr:site-specific integrase [Rheinheimera sp. UJ51]MCC5452932.1 site-specific integrase [Rheinheimera sp. UJ51]
MIKPLLSIHDKKPVYISKPPAFEPGFNRSDSMSMLESDGDWHVIIEYLQQFQEQPNTLASYLKEIERFALWLIHEKQKPISAVNRADWLSYLDFIQSPPPNWCSGKQRKYLPDGVTLNSRWRPFEIRTVHAPLATKSIDIQDEPELVTGLSKTSQDLAKRIIESMYTFLVVAGHLNANPAMSPRTRNKSSVTKKSVTERTLSDQLVDFTIDTLYNAQKQAVTEREVFRFLRARYIIQLFMATGLRLTEAAKHSYADITIRDDRWFLNIVGKGDKPRSIELFEEVISVIKEFRLAVGANSPTPLYNDPMKLIPSKNINKAISGRRIDQILRESFDLACRAKLTAAEAISNISLKGQLLREASYLEKASAHWLRHAHATYFIKYSGQNLKATMQRLGHSDVGTTMIYLHED